MDSNILRNVQNQAISLAIEAKSNSELDELRLRYFGRKGIINDLFSNLKNESPENRKEAGKQLNHLKQDIEQVFDDQIVRLNSNIIIDANFDPTLPGQKPPLGHQHPVTQTIEEIARIFENIGFARIRYPEITTDWYCFEGVNVPPDHPSRDDQETFFLKDGRVLSTHTTSGLLQEVERVKTLPIRMLHIAKCYRRQIDISHTLMFHQFEGWLLDDGVNIGHLKWVLDYFAKQYFGEGRVTRLRPHHFQYTEPSFEVDITCGACNGRGCRFCKDGWTELGGSGMAHPNMIKNAGLDPDKITGFGFGWGVERVLAMKHGINDIRQLYYNNTEFLKQF